MNETPITFKAFFYKIEVSIFDKVIHEDFATEGRELLSLREYYGREYQGHKIEVTLCEPLKGK